MDSTTSTEYNLKEQPIPSTDSSFANHTHDGLNSLKIKQTAFVTYDLIYGGLIFTAHFPCVIKRISEVHAITATGTSVIELLTSGQAVGGGTTITSFSLGTARDVPITTSTNYPVNTGERVSVTVSGSYTGIAYQCITLEIEY